MHTKNALEECRVCQAVLLQIRKYQYYQSAGWMQILGRHSDARLHLQDHRGVEGFLYC